MATAQITTLSLDHKKLVKDVVHSVQKIEPSFEEEKALPPQEEPVPDSPDLNAIKAERVGSEELIIKPIERDVSNLWKIIKSFFFGGGTWLRSGQTKEATPMLKHRNQDKKTIGSKYDADQLNVGE